MVRTYVGLILKRSSTLFDLGGEALVEGVVPSGDLGACGACPVDAACVQRAIGVGDNEAVEACLLLLGAEGRRWRCGLWRVRRCWPVRVPQRMRGRPGLPTSVAAVPRLSAVRATPRAEG